MPHKRDTHIKTAGVTLAVLPTILLVPLTAAALVVRTVFADAAWSGWPAFVIAVLTALNPGILLLIGPLWLKLYKSRGGYAVREAVPAEGVGLDTLNRCAAIAEAQSQHPIADCLKSYCGDVAAPPDKFVEMPGFGVSAQFSNQMIHAGSAEYLRKLGVEVPDIPGAAAHISLEGRALGYYRFFDPAELKNTRSGLLRAAVVSAAFKVAVWTLFAVTGTRFLALAVAGEAVSFALSLWLMQRALKMDTPGITG